MFNIDKITPALKQTLDLTPAGIGLPANQCAEGEIVKGADHCLYVVRTRKYRGRKGKSISYWRIHNPDTNTTKSKSVTPTTSKKTHTLSEKQNKTKKMHLNDLKSTNSVFNPIFSQISNSIDAKSVKNTKSIKNIKNTKINKTPTTNVMCLRSKSTCVVPKPIIRDVEPSVDLFVLQNEKGWKYRKIDGLDLLMIKHCGGDGDCLFRCIATALISNLNLILNRNIDNNENNNENSKDNENDISKKEAKSKTRRIGRPRKKKEKIINEIDELIMQTSALTLINETETIINDKKKKKSL